MPYQSDTIANVVDRLNARYFLPAIQREFGLSRQLRIGVKEVRKLVDAGDIPAARFGPRRVIRIAKSALVRVLRGRGGQRT